MTDMTDMTSIPDSLPFADRLAQQGYTRSPETRIFMRPDYAGIAYSDGDEAETRIGAIISAADDLTVLSRELARHCTDWPSRYHLGPDRANLLRPFKTWLAGADVLEIGAGCGALTRYLGESGANVLALEGSPRRAAIASSRVRDLDNVTVLAERFDRFEGAAWQGRFAVVTLIGVLEYAALFTPGEEPALAMLVRVRDLLKPGGHLLLALENQLGLKYFAGAPEDHTGEPMLGIEGRYEAGGPRTFGRKVLRELLNRAGFVRQDWLLPFPDYKLPVSIVTEAGLACPDFDAAALAWQSARRDPQLPQRLYFAPELAWPVLDANGLTADLANSFLVAAGPAEPAAQPRAGAAPADDTLAYHYSTGNRRAAFCKETRFVRREDGGIVARYTPLGSSREAEGELVRFRIPEEAEYVRGEALSARLVRCVTREGWSVADVAKIMHLYLDIVQAYCHQKGTWINIATADTQVPGNCLDITPQNIVLTNDGSWHIIDNEWTYKQDIQLGWLIFRSILLLIYEITRFAKQNNMLPAINHLNFTIEVFHSLGYHISKEDIYHFNKLENQFQIDVGLAYTEDHLNKYHTCELIHEYVQTREKEIDVLSHKLHWNNKGPVTWQTVGSFQGCVIYTDFVSKIASFINRFSHNKRYQFRRLKKELQKTPIFDKNYYIQEDKELINYRLGLIHHYMFHGTEEGRNPNPYFFTSWYLTEYPDVVMRGYNPLLHFLLYGIVENCNPNPYFLTSWYIEEYPHVKEMGINPLLHYIIYGKKEGTKPNPYFDPVWYAKTYLQDQPDIEPFAHFLSHPLEDMYNPNQNFDTNLYLQSYPFVELSKMHPLQHYINITYPSSRKYMQYLKKTTRSYTINKVSLSEKVRFLGVTIRKFVEFFFNTSSYNVISLLKILGFQLTLKELKKSLFGSNIDNDSSLQYSTENLFSNLQEMVIFCQKKGKIFLENDILRLITKQEKSVLFISHDLNLTGAPVVLINFAVRVKENGWNPIVISPKDGELREKLDNSRIPTIIYPDIYYSDIVLQCRNLFDLIIVGTIIGSPIISVLNGTNVPVLWWIHEANASYHKRNRELMPISLSNNIHVYCAGHYAQSILKKYYPQYNSEILLYNTPDYADLLHKTTSSFLNKTNGKTIFGCIGTLEERKGQDILIKSIHLIPDELRQKCIFVFVGQEYYSPIKEAISKIMVQYPDQVKYIPQLSPEKIVEFYNYIDCLVCPSRDDPMPVVVAEAMALSKCIICSENTGTAKLLMEMHGGFVYHSNSPIELASCLIRVVRSKETLQTMTKNARRIYEKYFSTNAFDSSISQITSKLLKKGYISLKDKISIIIPTYNAGEQFEMLLENLHLQRYINDLEIIVVDSGSSDATPEIAEHHGAHVIRISKSQFSHSHSRNYGAKSASGKYLLFMTQDALPSDNEWIVGLAQPLLNGQASAVSCREQPYSNCDIFGQISIWRHSVYMGILHRNRILSMPERLDSDSIRKNAQLNNVACMIPRNIFNQYQYRGNYAEDLDLGLRLIKDGHKLSLLAEPCVVHSHTRSPFYYLKRCFVDIISLKSIIDSLFIQSIDIQECINKIVTCYITMVTYKTSLLYVSNNKYVRNNLNAWTYWMLTKIRKNLIYMTIEEIYEIVDKSNLNLDVHLQNFVKDILNYNRTAVNIDYEIINSIEYYISNIAIPYLLRKFFILSDKEISEFSDAVEKFTGQSIGNIFAACYYHCHNECTILNKWANKLQEGI